MRHRKELRFDADFKCVTCGSIIGISTFLAIVQGPGIQVDCRHCSVRYAVTENGAQVLGDDLDDIELQGILPSLAGDAEIPQPKFNTIGPEER